MELGVIFDTRLHALSSKVGFERNGDLSAAIVERDAIPLAFLLLEPNERCSFQPFGFAPILPA